MSRFVSAGTNDEPIERDDEWIKARQNVEAEHMRKQELAKQQESGKSLYEVLQANKGVLRAEAAKQEAFEEKHKLKNQFRALDEDEVDFLDSVLESTRAKEAALKRETAEQLEAFRKQQEQAGKVGGGEGEGDGDDAYEEGRTWQPTGRKRKKIQEKENMLRGIKLRKMSSSTEEHHAASPIENPKPEALMLETQADQASVSTSSLESTVKRIPDAASSEPPPSASISKGAGLVAYSSDEDD